MIADRPKINLHKKKIAAVGTGIEQTHLCLMIDHQGYGYNNSWQEFIAPIVDRIAAHGQKEVNLKTTKVQPYEVYLFFALMLSERSVSYLAVY
jgi:hypothetical protein